MNDPCETTRTKNGNNGPTEKWANGNNGPLQYFVSVYKTFVNLCKNLQKLFTKYFTKFIVFSMNALLDFFFLFKILLCRNVGS